MNQDLKSTRTYGVVPEKHMESYLFSGRLNKSKCLYNQWKLKVEGFGFDTESFSSFLFYAGLVKLIKDNNFKGRPLTPIKAGQFALI